MSAVQPYYAGMPPQWTPPPNWPPPPHAGWVPPQGWAPDPAWGPPPPGWNFWPGAIYQPLATGHNGIGRAGGAIGIAGAVLSLIPLLGIIIGIPMGLVAIILSSIGLSRAGRLNDGNGMSVAGLVLGILTVIFKLIPGINLL
jgi:hypothetical protein